MKGINFIAIDFETATAKRASICEAGICVVKDGKVVETRSWLVRPEANAYSYWNIQVHGIRPADTEDAPDFPEVWAQWKFSGDKHKFLQVDTERTFHQRYPLAML